MNLLDKIMRNLLENKIVLIAIILITIVGIGYRFAKHPSSEDKPPNLLEKEKIPTPAPKEVFESGLTACPKDVEVPIFSVLPMRLEDFTAFRPLGFVTFPSHIFGAKHSNFVINQPSESKKGLPVRFPSDAVVTQITFMESDKGSGYQLVFYPCEKFKSYLFHLGTISEALTQAFDAGNPICKDFRFGLGDDIRKCELKTNVRVKMGDLAGTNDGSSGVDWGAVDYRITHKFANPNRYDFDYLHYVSPVPYLISELKDQMTDRLKSYDGTVARIAEPRWGTIAQDILGTAQGNWFLTDKTIMNTQDFSIFLALLHDYIDPAEPIIVMGSSVAGLQFGIYSFLPQSTGVINRDFKDVKPDGKIYCYEKFKSDTTRGKIYLTQISGSILMTMPDDKTLRVAYSSGVCADAPAQLSNSATTFLR
jgi:hypothetical protein